MSANNEYSKSIIYNSDSYDNVGSEFIETNFINPIMISLKYLQGHADGVDNKSSMHVPRLIREADVGMSQNVHNAVHIAHSLFGWNIDNKHSLLSIQCQKDMANNNNCITLQSSYASSAVSALGPSADDLHMVTHDSFFRYKRYSFGSKDNVGTYSQRGEHAMPSIYFLIGETLAKSNRPISAQIHFRNCPTSLSYPYSIGCQPNR